VVTRHREILITADIGYSTDDNLAIRLDEDRVGVGVLPGKVGEDIAIPIEAEV
jgi:hypothetical protein